MKIAGIVLIVLQCVAVISSFISGKNPFNNGFLYLIGYFLCGIVGVILLIVAHKRKNNANSKKIQTKETEKSEDTKNTDKE